MNTSSQSNEKEQNVPSVWDDSVAPGGYVCTVCGIPTEDEPCAEHGPDAGPACPGCGHCCCPYKSEWQALGCAGESDVVRACELLRLPPGKNLQDDHLKGGA